jgi:hypothetical protein
MAGDSSASQHLLLKWKSVHETGSTPLDRFDEARTIYVADKDKPRDNGKTSADIVRDDFAEMRKFGINTSDMQRITTLFARTAP